MENGARAIVRRRLRRGKNKGGGARVTKPGAEAASKPRHGDVRAFVVVMLPFSCGYYVSYLYRSVNAVIAPQLIEEFGLDATDLGFLTAARPMKIPRQSV